MNAKRSLGRAAERALKALGLFAILEPAWMLLPFAGFLYGSVLNIRILNRSRVAAPLAHFVLPVHTAFTLEFDLGSGRAVGEAERLGPPPTAGRMAPATFRDRMQERMEFFTSGL